MDTLSGVGVLDKSMLVVQALAAATQADCVKSDQAGVAGQAQHHGQCNLPRAEMAEGFADGTVAMFVEFAGQPAQGKAATTNRSAKAGKASPPGAAAKPPIARKATKTTSTSKAAAARSATPTKAARPAKAPASKPGVRKSGKGAR